MSELKEESAVLCVFCTNSVFLNLQVFIKDLVWNLFGEGNDVFKEGEWTKSIEMYTESLSIAEYADSEDICVPTGLLEKLYANRAAAYLNIVPVSRSHCSFSPKQTLSIVNTPFLHNFKHLASQEDQKENQYTSITFRVCQRFL